MHHHRPIHLLCCGLFDLLLEGQTANIPDADLLHVNYHNLVEGLLPYSVALDVAQQCVVLAIRGSLSVEDCVTGESLQPLDDVNGESCRRTAA
jgi:hypothetical protein